MDPELAADFASLGAGAAVPLSGGQDEAAIEVWAENADSLDAWLACTTQWRIIAPAMGALIWQGLDYPGVDVVLRRLGPEDPDAVFADLRIMENEALATFDEVRG